jgi:antirestriction protein ArdC
MANKNFDMRQMVTDRILDSLEKGTVPWRKGWKPVMTSSGDFFGRGDMNAFSKTAYRGINVMLTASAGFEDPRWLTLKQCLSLGGRVKREEFSNSTPVIFWKFNKKEVQDDTGKIEIKTWPLMRYYKVWNVSQCQDLDESKLPQLMKVEEIEDTEESERLSIEAAEKVIKDFLASKNAPKYKEEPSNKAYYRPSADTVVVPDRTQFDNVAEFYSTSFHELGHSTGHETRLKRDLMNCFGDHKYSKEELVAEMTAAILCGTVGIDCEKVFDNSAAYVSSWLKELKNDKNLVISASQQAQKAVDLILGTTFEESKVA